MIKNLPPNGDFPSAFSIFPQESCLIRPFNSTASRDLIVELTKICSYQVPVPLWWWVYSLSQLGSSTSPRVDYKDWVKVFQGIGHMQAGCKGRYPVVYRYLPTHHPFSDLWPLLHIGLHFPLDSWCLYTGWFPGYILTPTQHCVI